MNKDYSGAFLIAISCLLSGMYMGGCIGSSMSDSQWRKGTSNCFLFNGGTGAVCYKAVVTTDSDKK
jgi:hypothetical protein